MAHIIPNDIPKAAFTGDHSSELQTLHLLKKQLPDDYTVFHGVHWAWEYRSRMEFGEIDFIVMNRSGSILLIEQKDGELVESGGDLLKSYRDREKSVIRQVHRSIELVLEKYKRLNPGRPPLERDYLLYLPGYHVRDLNAAGLDESRVVDAGARDKLAGRIEAVLGPGSDKDRETFDRVYGFFCQTLRVVPDVAAFSTAQEQRFVRQVGATAEILANLEMEPFRLRFEGAAGSGKSLLALQFFKRQVERGRRVLLVCFNRPLGESLRRTIPAASPGYINNFHGFCTEFLESRGERLEMPAKPGAAFWNDLQERVAGQEISGDWLFDALIVDEGQDFEQEWLEILRLFVPGNGDILWLEDGAQNLYGKERVKLDGFVTYRCRDNHRNPACITRFIRDVLPVDFEPRNDLPGMGVGVQGYADPADQARIVDRIVQDRIRQGFAHEDIVILTTHGVEKSVFYETESIGGIPLRRPTGEYRDGREVLSPGKIGYDSIYRFKGQQSPAVILVDVDADPDRLETARRTLYCGMTRATLRLDIVAAEYNPGNRPLFEAAGAPVPAGMDEPGTRTARQSEHTTATPADRPTTLPPFDRDDLTRAMALARDYLVNACGEDGRFRYLARVDGGRVGDEYNIVRHCGAVYAMASSALHSPRSNDFAALSRAAGYLQTAALAPLPGHPGMAAIWSYPGTNDVVAGDTAKLGASGLGLAAFALMERLQPGTIPRDTFDHLEAFLRHMQKPDGGFHSRFVPEKGGRCDDWTSLYYPGEAALGLLLHHEANHSPRALDAAVRALLYLADSRAGLARVPPDHWALIATARLFALPDFDGYSEDGGRLAAHVEQVVHSLKRGLPLGREGSSRPCAVACRLEGLFGAMDVLSGRSGLLMEELLASINHGMQVLLAAQVREGPLAGGMPGRWPPSAGSPNAGDLEVRIDYVQHALSAMLEYDRHFDACAMNPLSGHAPSAEIRPLLEESLALSAGFIVKQQRTAGNFRYQYDWTKGEVSGDDNAVRQSGTQWALALHARATGSEASMGAGRRALAFFLKHSRLAPDGGRYVAYPGDEDGWTGTLALCALTLAELLRDDALADAERGRYTQYLQEFITALVSARTDKGLWHSRYRHEDGGPCGEPSPYFDGECLLALVRTAKYVEGFEHLQPAIMKSASMGFLHHVFTALRRDRDSPVTKGYYQWSTMAFHELYTSGWPDTEVYGEHILYLADWMIDVHRVLKKPRNTAYAYEGLAHAWATADAMGDTVRRDRYREVIDLGLSRLLSWQVGHSLANPFIRGFEPKDDDLGGMQGAANDGALRIDATQHLLHAVLLCLQHVYQPEIRSPAAAAN